MKAHLDVWDRLEYIMSEENYERVVYTYRLGLQGKPIKPYLTKLFADRNLLNTLRDDFGGGEFRLMIREGRKLIFSGEISIYSPKSGNLQS